MGTLADSIGGIKLAIQRSTVVSVVNTILDNKMLVQL